MGRWDGRAVFGPVIGGLGLLLAARRPVVMAPTPPAPAARQLPRPRGIIIESEFGGRLLVEAAEEGGRGEAEN